MPRRTDIKLYLCPVHAGYPSPAQDYTDGALDLNEHLIANPAATFFVRAAGDSMQGAGIHDGDILVVDRSLTARHGVVVVAIVDGEFTVKRFSSRNGTVRLMAANDAYPSITPTGECVIWGVVTYSIHAVSR